MPAVLFVERNYKLPKITLPRREKQKFVSSTVTVLQKLKIGSYVKLLTYLCIVIAASQLTACATSTNLSIPRTAPSQEVCASLLKLESDEMGEVQRKYADTIDKYRECALKNQAWINWFNRTEVPK